MEWHFTGTPGTCSLPRFASEVGRTAVLAVLVSWMRSGLFESTATRRGQEILVLEPDAGLREFLCGVLRCGGFRVETVASAEDLLAAVHRDPPRLVILEVRLGDISGYEVCRAIREAHQYRVLIVFMSADRIEPLDRTAGLLIGADDYLSKPISGDELLARARALLRRAGRSPGIGVAVNGNRRELTVREREVLRLLADGLDQTSIARKLGIAPQTVGKHIERILFKLPARSRAEAVAISYRRG